jgi:hypothetical protein
VSPKARNRKLKRHRKSILRYHPSIKVRGFSNSLTFSSFGEMELIYRTGPSLEGSQI